jgi:putative ABC transport system permease protein
MARRSLLRRRWQTALMILSVALGVGVVVAIDLANTSARRAFQLSSQTIAGQSTHRIVGGPSGVPVSVYTQLRNEWGIRDSAPVIEAFATAIEQGEQVRILGFDPLAETPFRSFLDDVTYQSGLEAFFTDSHTALAGAGLAGSLNLQPGDQLPISINGQTQTLTILGVVYPSRGDDEASQWLLMDIAAAQEITGMPAAVTRIDLILEPDQVDRLRDLLPGGVRLESASEQTQTVAQLTDAFDLNLRALSLLALVVGMFLIYNSITFSVLQRRRTLGILRSLGVTGEQLFGVIMLETLIVGLIGSMVGLGLGWILGQGAVLLVTQTINDLYFVVSVRDISVTLLSALKGIGAGVGASLIAAAVPAWEAARVPPVTVMRRSETETTLRRRLPQLALVGLGLTVLGGLVLAVLPRSLVASFAGLFGILLGLAFMVPAVTASMMSRSSKFIGRLFGLVGRLGARTVARSISRTGIAVAALMVSLSVAIGVSIMISSFRETVTNWLEVTVPADIYIAAPSVGGARPMGEIPTNLVEGLAEINGVDHIETARTTLIGGPQGEVILVAVDAARQRDESIYRFAAGSAEDVWQQVQAGAVIVSEPFAYRNNIQPDGQRIELLTDEGLQSFEVVGVYYDYSTERGTVLMTLDTYRQYWQDESITSIAVYLQPQVEAQDVLDQLRAYFSGTGLQVQSNRALRELALEIFDRTFLITAALRVLAVVVAFIGVLSALLALQLERSREFATLQALGLTGAGLWRLMLVETGLIGASAGIFAMPTGAILALVLIYVINLRSFGWTIQLQATGWVFIQAMLVAILAAWLAAIYPAIRLGRMRLSEALRRE